MHLEIYGDRLCAAVAAGAFASTGNQVVLRAGAGPVGQSLARGQCPFREPGVERLLAEQQASGRLLLGALDEGPDDSADAVFLALEPHELEQALELVRRIGAREQNRWLLINQSSFPVGSTERLQQELDAVRPAPAPPAEVVSLPDLLREGTAIEGYTRPGHWLLGCVSLWAEKRVREILRPFNRRRDDMLVMSPREAEFTRLAITGMLATRLSFMNDMATLADTLSVDIEAVRQGVGADPRIGEAYLYPGCGFGGPNFSRDVMSLASTLAHSGVGSELLEQVLAINERQKEILFRKLWRHYGTDISGRGIAIWGAAFKPGTTRVDNAPVLRLIDALLAQGARVRIHDPEALPELMEHYRGQAGIEPCEDPYEAAREADALMLVTEWKSYWSPDFDKLRSLMNTPLILDGRNIYAPEHVRECGFEYYGIGRG